MFFLEKKVLTEVPNRRNSDGQPLHAFQWQALYYCGAVWPLKMLLEHMPPNDYRIVYRKGGKVVWQMKM